jgi:hypothetical protein
MVEFRRTPFSHERFPWHRNLGPDPLRIAAVDAADYANSADVLTASPMIDCHGAL